MFTHHSARRLRRALLPLSAACSLVLGAAVVTPAAADTPAAWGEAPTVSTLEVLLIVVIIPLGLAALLTLLAVLPWMASDRGYQPGQSWRGEAEWFGGPTKGVESAAEVTPEQIESRSKDTGGTSANW